jgi:3-hydroxyacyl-CoA dehydrogenase/enoyl-CoA hydratase/3-hydroxybutyryl-CoA epimerase
MGPFRLIDEIGVDITMDIAETLEKAFGERYRAPKILGQMRGQKMLGRKSGIGFYNYDGKQQLPNESLQQWRRPSTGHPERSEGPHETRDSEVSRSARNDHNDDLALRLVYLMVNEAARCLEEKVVATPEDADYGMILGTGFAPFRGGPLRFADHFGIAEMVRAGDRHGGKFKPCDLLRQHAEKGTKFYEER